MDYMSPELKFHAIIVSIVTLIVFYIFTQVTAIVSTYPWLTVFSAALISLGLYRFICSIFLTTFRNVTKFKKFILGASYMEGVWVGFFLGHENKIRYLVESFEQDLNELIIRGKVYLEDGTYHCSYVSQKATIDTKNGKLSYSYDADAITNTHINPGLARFEIERESRESKPHRITGYSSDLFNSKKLMAFEEKVSEKTSIPLQEAIDSARKVFEKYKNYTGSS